MDSLSPSSDLLTDFPDPKPSADTPPCLPNSAKSPWFSIWFHPRQTMAWIIWKDPAQQVLLLAVLAGIVQAFDNASRADMGVVSGLTVMMLFGALGGLISLYFGGWVLRIVASFLGGTASPEESRAALAWSYVPQITLLVLAFLPMLFLFGPETFHSASPIFDAKLAADATFGLASGIILMLSGAASLVMTIWTVVILVANISVVNRFSTWRAFFTILIPVLLLVGLLLLVVVVEIL